MYKSTQEVLLELNLGSPTALTELRTREISRINTNLRTLDGYTIYYVRTPAIQQAEECLLANLDNKIVNVSSSFLLKEFEYSCKLDNLNNFDTNKLYTAYKLLLNNGFNLQTLKNMYHTITSENLKLFNRKQFNDLITYTQINTITLTDICIIHFYVQYLNVTPVANGCISRLLQRYLLNRISPKLANLPFEQALYKDNLLYESMIRKSLFMHNESIDITPFIEYMLTVLLDVYMNNMCNNIRLARRFAILNLLRYELRATTKSISQRLGMKHCTVNQNFICF